MVTLLLALVVLALLGVLPAWPHSRGWGYGPSGALGAVLVVVAILFMTGRLSGGQTIGDRQRCAIGHCAGVEPLATGKMASRRQRRRQSRRGRTRPWRAGASRVVVRLDLRGPMTVRMAAVAATLIALSAATACGAQRGCTRTVHPAPMGIG